MRFHEVRGETNIERSRRDKQKTAAQKSLDYKFAHLPAKLGHASDKELTPEAKERIARLDAMLDEIQKGELKEGCTLKDAIIYIDEYLTEATVNKEKQEILDNQNALKKNFAKISADLKKMVISNAGDNKIKIKADTFFKKHEDHKEQHYLVIYTMDPTDELSKTEISKILSDIGSKVEKEFKATKKEFLDKGLYFDNKKKDEVTRFVELHYDFY